MRDCRSCWWRAPTGGAEARPCPVAGCGFPTICSWPATVRATHAGKRSSTWRPRSAIWVPPRPVRARRPSSTRSRTSSRWRRGWACGSPGQPTTPTTTTSDRAARSAGRSRSSPSTPSGSGRGGTRPAPRTACRSRSRPTTSGCWHGPGPRRAASRAAPALSAAPSVARCAARSSSARVLRWRAPSSRSCSARARRCGCPRRSGSWSWTTARSPAPSWSARRARSTCRPPAVSCSPAAASRTAPTGARSTTGSLATRPPTPAISVPPSRPARRPAAPSH
jgi:hypothetical protein